MNPKEQLMKLAGISPSKELQPDDPAASNQSAGEPAQNPKTMVADNPEQQKLSVDEFKKLPREQKIRYLTSGELKESEEERTPEDDRRQKRAQDKRDDDRDQTGRKDARDYAYGEDPRGTLEMSSQPGNDRETKPETRDALYENYLPIPVCDEQFFATDLKEIAANCGLASFREYDQKFEISAQNTHRVCFALFEASTKEKTKRGVRALATQLLKEDVTRYDKGVKHQLESGMKKGIAIR